MSKYVIITIYFIDTKVMLIKGLRNTTERVILIP